MPGTCEGKDIYTNVAPPPTFATATGARAKRVDECELAAGGQRCPPGLCGSSGRLRPILEPSPLWGLRDRPAAATAPAAARSGRRAPKGDPTKLLEDRRKAAARLRPKVDALVEALEAARGALAADEEELLAILKRWGKALPRAPRRRR